MDGKRYGMNRFWAAIPPWLIIGAVVILAPVFIFMTLENINRQKEQTTRLLVEKGAALIRSFEAGARTGIGLRWGGFQLQKLLMETAEDLFAERDAEEKVWGSMVKQAIKRRKPGFNESYYGFKSFGKLLEEARDRKLIDLEFDAKSGGYILTRVATG
jgi:hypothetical protein